MKIVEGSNKAPVIYTAHYVSHDLKKIDNRVVINTEQKVIFSNYGTKKQSS